MRQQDMNSYNAFHEADKNACRTVVRNAGRVLAPNL
jgi:hypothetical protein